MFRKDSSNRWLPASRSKKMKRRGPVIRLGLVILLIAALAWFVPAGQAQEDPVTVTVEFNPTAVVPGDSLTATAIIDIQDGSTLQTVSWMQTGGAVVASITPTGVDTATVTLAAESVFKAHLIDVVSEPPIGPDQLPPNVPVPPGEFPGGLQDRFQVVPVNPFSLEEAGKVTLEATVTTTSGVYKGVGDIHTMLPWKVKADILTQANGIPVLLHGKDQASYDWVLKGPWNSSATLMDAASQNPEFTPDVTGKYTLTVTDLATNKTVNFDVYSGTWQGIITGQDMDERPLARNCVRCHREGGRAPDIFTDWAQTGHAEIFTDNLNTSTHYSESCFACHTVGFDLDVDNYGFDEFDYLGFLNAGLLNNPSPDNWTTMLADFPVNARHANIQCENCHGPQSSLAHNSSYARYRTAVMGTDPRASISANVCAVCHGEPLRHARFQQWQLSGHANYELAIDEGESGNCSRCHTGNGFLTWLPILLDEVSGDPTANINVSWTEDETQPQTCATCHDPHNIGTTTGNNSNATVRISDETPLLIAGFKAPANPGEDRGVGRGAICMTCHNTRRGLRNDNVPVAPSGSERSRAPHGGVQADILMGQNAYLIDLGSNDPLGYPEGLPGSHANTQEQFPADRNLEDTCVKCHMVETPPPPDLAYQLGGTNHTFYASPDICDECHLPGQLDAVREVIVPKIATLQDGLEAAILAVMQLQISAGNTIQLSGRTIADTAEITEIVFGETRGQQAISVTFADTSTVGPTAMSSVYVVAGDGTRLGGLYDFVDDSLPKAGWNWCLIGTDKSLGVHNYNFANQVLDASIAAVEALVGT